MTDPKDGEPKDGETAPEETASEETAPEETAHAISAAEPAADAPQVESEDESTTRNDSAQDAPRNLEAARSHEEKPAPFGDAKRGPAFPKAIAEHAGPQEEATPQSAPSADAAPSGDAGKPAASREGAAPQERAASHAADATPQATAHEEGHGHGEGATLRQLFIVTILIGGLIGLHRFAVTDASEFDPTAMLALGFVILASFTIGALVDVIKLPHITGYLVAGMVFGTSIAALIPWSLPPPFDVGVLHGAVIDQLMPLETLAVALIAISAGGEMLIESLKSGLRAITSILAARLIVMLTLVTGFFYLISGRFSWIALPGLGDLGDAFLPIALTVGVISFGTAPAATIAVIKEAKAKGPTATTILSTVVLTDVVVVIFFGIFSSWAISTLSGDDAAGDQNLALELLIHIAGSVAMGALLGWGVAAYLRFVGKELLLFIAGVVYAGALVASTFHFDAMLVFLTTGFVVANFSKSGHALIEAVERLSLPVYVVFFTLAGARLHLDEVFHIFGFAIAIVLVRILAVWIGVGLGAKLGAANAGTRRYGWMGFLSQAGVSLAFAGIINARFGEHGAAVSNLLIAAIAVNEIIGPIMLKLGLSLSGEVGPPKPTEAAVSVPKQAAPETSRYLASETKVDWGELPDTGSSVADEDLANIRIELQKLATDVAAGPMRELEESAKIFYGQIRRAYLKEYNRLRVQARIAQAIDDPAERERAEVEFSKSLGAAESKLADAWRELVLSHSAELKRGLRWTPRALVEFLEDIAAGAHDHVGLPYHPRSFNREPNDGFLTRMAKRGLRFRRGFARIFGRKLRPRKVPLRTIATYHLSFETPTRLETVATLFVQMEQQIISRTRQAFDEIVLGYDQIRAQIAEAHAARMPSSAAGATEEQAAGEQAAGEQAAGEQETTEERVAEERVALDLHARIEEHRARLEEAIGLATDEAKLIAHDGAVRTGRVFARALRDMESDLEIMATFALNERERQPSRAFAERIEALDALTGKMESLQRSNAGELASLAMELKLVGLETKIKGSLATHAQKLEADMRARGSAQAQRVADALAQALQACKGFSTLERASELSAAIHLATEPAQKAATDALNLVKSLHDSLLEEQKIARLLDALATETLQLSQHYEVASGRTLRGEQRLPDQLPSVEVPFRQMVSEFIETRVTPKLLRATRASADSLEPLEEAMREADRLTAFNRDLAIAELDLSLEDVVSPETKALVDELLAAQLERSRAIMAGFATRADDWPKELSAAVHDAVLGTLDELRGQLVDGQLNQAKVGQLQRNTKRLRWSAHLARLPGSVKAFGGELLRLSASLIGEARLEKFRQQLGLPHAEAPRAAMTRIESPTSPIELPLVYRRVFESESRDARDVPAARESLVVEAKEALMAKGKSRLRNVAVVGMDGVGRGSLVTATTRGARFRRVFQLTFHKPTDVTELAAKLKEIGDAPLVVVQGLRWLSSPKPGGFAPLRALVAHIAADGNRRAWLLDAEKTFWAHACAAARLGDVFPVVIQLKPLNPRELAEAVLERHRWSGFAHAFVFNEDASRAEQLFNRLTNRWRRPIDHYFHSLHSATDGLIQDALRMWVASICGLEDETVRIGKVPPDPLFELSRLSDEPLLQLLQLMRFGWIDVEGFASSLRVDRGAARAMIGRLIHWGVVEEELPGVYRITFELRGAIARLLERRGWL